MATCDDRQLTQAQREAAYSQQARAGVIRAIRPFSGNPSIPNIIDYLNRELVPAVKQSRQKINDIYRPVVDNAPSGNPLSFFFSTNTTNADPTTGRIRLNAATQDTATVMRVSQTNGRLADVTPWLDVMSGGATTPLGVITLTDATDPTRFIRFDLTSMTDQGAYWDLVVSPIESSHDNPFVDENPITIGFIPGVGGATPATVPGAAVGALTGEVTKPAGSAVTTITRSTDFTWTGKHQWNSWIVLGTQQNETAFTAGVLNVTLLDTVTRLYILINGDGDIQTVTPAGGTTTTGRVVFMMIVGSGVKTLKHAFSGGGVGRLLLPNNRDHKFGNRQSVWLVGDGANGWLVSLTPPEAMSGLSVMGTATSTAGYPAAITASNGNRYLGTNAAGTALSFQSLSTSFPGAPIYDVRDYGAVGDGTTDDGPAINLAIAAANALPGTIYLMSNHRIATATTQITSNGVWVKGRGDGFLAGTQIYIDIAGTSATGFHFNGGQYQGISNCYFRSGKIYTSECYAVELEEGFCQFAHFVRVDHHWGGIRIKSAAEARLSHIGTRNLVGATGIKHEGSLGNNCYRCVIDTALLDQPPPTSYPATVAGNDTAWAPGTAYSLGQFKEANGNLYQCTTAGTSGSAPGPSGFPSSATDPGGVFSGRITDGSCQWGYVCPLTFTHILQENYAYTLVIDKVATLNGVYPYRMVDTAATGTSRPAFAFVNFLETDHCWRGVLLERGQEVTFQGCSMGACLSDSGAKVASTFGFDWTFIGCKQYGNAKHGFDINASYGHIVDCKIGNNGQLTANTYDGISIAASVTDFQVSGNESLNSGSSQRYGISIAASCDDYNVVANNFSGNATAAILNTPGYATTRVVAFNTPFDGIVNAMVATGAAITTDKLGALTGEVTKASGSTATVVVRSTDFTWTGKHLFGSHVTLNTQQNYTGSLPAAITLNDTANRLYILVTGDGDIQTITPNSGTTDTGRIVFCYVVGTGTKTIKDAFSGGGVGRLRCPNNTDFTVGNRDSFILVGDSTNGWLVFPMHSRTMLPTGLTDGDKGHITVSSSGTVWTIDAGVVDTTELANDAVTDAKLRNGQGNSVIGRSVNSTGDVADIVCTAGTRGVLRENGSGTLAFGTVHNSGLDDMAQSRIKGRAEGAGTGSPSDLTPTQVAAIIDGEAITWTASQTFTHLVRFNQIFTSTVTSQLDDLPIGNVNIVKLTPTAPREITGMVSNGDGQVVIMINESTTTGFTLKITDESDSTTGTASSAANRFALPSSTSLSIPGEGMAIFWYDPGVSRWRGMQ